MKHRSFLPLGLAAMVALTAAAGPLSGCVVRVPALATIEPDALIVIQGPATGADAGTLGMALPARRAVQELGSLARADLLFTFADGTSLPRSITDPARFAGEQFGVDVIGVPVGQVKVAITLFDGDGQILGTGAGEGEVKAGLKTTIDVEIIVKALTGDLLVRGRVTREGGGAPIFDPGTPAPSPDGGSPAPADTIADVKLLAGRFAIKANTKVRSTAYSDSIGLLDRTLKVELLKRYKRLSFSIAVDDNAPSDRRPRGFQVREPAGNLLGDGQIQRLDAPLPVSIDISRYDWIEIALPYVSSDYEYVPFEDVRLIGLRFER